MAGGGLVQRPMALRNAPDAEIGDHRASAKTLQVLQIDLLESTLEDILQSARSDTSLQVSFGKNPTLRYGTKSAALQVSPCTYRNELYSQPSTRNSQDLEFQGVLSHALAMRKAEEASADMDVALATLQHQMASLSKEKQSMQTTLVDEVKPGKRTSAAKMSSNHRKGLFGGNGARSVPMSPSVAAINISSSGPKPYASLPSSQGSSTALKSTATRIPLLHLLAVKPISEEVVAKKLHIHKDLALNLLEKFGKRVEGDRLWQLTDRWYKELDVWRFPYVSDSSDRQTAVANAVRAFDRMRVARDDRLWQLLLPKDQRGKGICLSKLNLSTYNAIKSATPKPALPSVTGEIVKQGSDLMARAVSQETAKGKKLTGKDALSKDPPSKKKAGTRSSARVNKISSTPKASKTGGKKKNDSTIKSSEFVDPTVDESDDDIEAEQTKESNPLKPQVDRPVPSESSLDDAENSKTKSTKPVPTNARPRTKDVSIKGQAVKNRPNHSASVSSETSLSSARSMKSSPRHQHTSSVSSTTSTSVVPDRPVNKSRYEKEGTTKRSPPASSSDSGPTTGGLKVKKAPLFKNAQPKPSKPEIHSSDRGARPERPDEVVTSKRPARDNDHSVNSNGVARKKPKLAHPDESKPVQPVKMAHEHVDGDDGALPELDLADLKERKAEVQRAYIILHMEVSNTSNPPKDKSQEVWNLFHELRRLKEEIARRDHTPTELHTDLQSLDLPAKSTALIEAQYEKEYPIYKALYNELKGMESPPEAKMLELWTLHSRLGGLQVLMDDTSKEAIIDKVRVDMQGFTGSESPDVALSRRQTLELYGKYYLYLKEYEKANSSLRNSTSVSLTDVDADWEMRLRLQDMRRSITRGFTQMSKGLEIDDFEDEEFTNDSKPLDEAEMKMIAEKYTTEWPVWALLRDQLLSLEFGSVSPQEMNNLWERQGMLKKWKWQVWQASKKFPMTPESS